MIDYTYFDWYNFKITKILNLCSTATFSIEQSVEEIKFLLLFVLPTEIGGKEITMNNFEKYIPLLTVIQIILQILLGIIEFFTGNYRMIQSGLLCIIVSIFFIFIYQYEKQHEYISFVEYACHNNNLRFYLLPRIRIYLHQFKICNKVKIKELNITYLINGKMYQETPEPLCGDVTKIFQYTIEEIKEDITYTFVFWDDISNTPPIMQIKYGNQKVYIDVPVSKYGTPVYSKSVIRSQSFEIDSSLLPKKGEWTMEIRVKYQKAFNFNKIKMDTIICLPMLFGYKVGKMKYEIKLEDYIEIPEFYCYLYKISKGKKCYETVNKGCEKKKDNLGNIKFEAPILLDNLKKEQAFYFRIGTSHIDEENKF